jgi:hypothetical protein
MQDPYYDFAKHRIPPKAFFSLAQVYLCGYPVFVFQKIRFLHKSLTLAYPSRMDLFFCLRISISDNDMRFYSLSFLVAFLPQNT